MSKAFLPLAAVVAASLLASSAAAQFPRTPSLPPGWSHAEINVVMRRQAHTLIYDRGRVQAVTGSSLTLREQDGTVVTIQVSPAAKITIAGQPATLAQIRPREVAVTVGVDGAPAASVKVQVPAALAAILAHRGGRR